MVSSRLVAFVVALLLGMYFLSTGSFIIGLIFICLAILIPVA